MERISWIQSGSTYHRVEGDITNPEKLTDGIYEVGLDLSGWHLVRTGNKFVFDYKVYHLQREFINHIKVTYNKTKGNIGVLFNGTRGTGKTVTAKILANELNLPIVLVKSMGDRNDGLISYLSSFNFDCVFFFDEFEKQFKEGDCSILQIMDGVYNSEFRKIFLLTTNELSINQNLLSRPSRIRYVREFGNLEQEIVSEFLDDELKNPEYKEELMDYVDSLTISTIDILKAIVEEVNIHGLDAFMKFKTSFNVQNASYMYITVRARIDRNRCKDVGYTIDTFIKECTSYKNKYELGQRFNAEMKELDENSDRAQQIKDAYYAAIKRYASFEYENVYNQEKAWNKLRNNKDYFNEEIVIKVDTEKKVVVTECYDDLCFYYIENPNAKPSLYGKNTSELKYVL